MLKGIDLNQRIEFSSKSDDSEPKTIFVFKPMDTEAMLKFSADSQNGQLKITGTKVFDFLELSIIEINNYQEGKISDLLRTFPISVIAELVEEAGSINKMTGTDQKN